MLECSHSGSSHISQQYVPYKTFLLIDSLQPLFPASVAQPLLACFWKEKTILYVEKWAIQEKNTSLMTMRHIKAVCSKSNERKFVIQCVMDDYEKSNATIQARHP
jgi:hypothetical protein